MSRQSTIAFLRVLACVLVLLALVPHHHADGDATKPCAACVTAQSASSSLPAHAPIMVTPADLQPAPDTDLALPVSATYYSPLVPRAPPA